jgi:hypothetical protein
MRVTCSSCKRDLPDDAEFCQYCGKPLDVMSYDARRYHRLIGWFQTLSRVVLVLWPILTLAESVMAPAEQRSALGLEALGAFVAAPVLAFIVVPLLTQLLLLMGRLEKQTSALQAVPPQPGRARDPGSAQSSPQATQRFPASAAV